MNIIGRTTGLLIVSNATKNLQHNPCLTSICTSTVTFVLFVRTAVKATRSKADWSNIRSHTKKNSITCANTRDVVEVLRTKGTTTDTCLVMRIFGSNVPPVHTKQGQEEQRFSHENPPRKRHWP